MTVTKLSRTAVELSLNCERCYVLQYKHRISLPGLPFTLNSAVDNLCKNEFDKYRKEKKPHPFFETLELGNTVPFDHPEMDNWRNFRKGAYYTDHDKGYCFGGAVDDLWQKEDGSLIVSDVKATSKNIFNWEDTYLKWDYPKAYKRQLEMYQWVFRKLGFKVSNTGVLVYFNGLKNAPTFEGSLNFETHLIELECNDEWVEDAILHAKKLLTQKSLPKASEKCDKCNYLKKRWQLMEAT